MLGDLEGVIESADNRDNKIVNIAVAAAVMSLKCNLNCLLYIRVAINRFKYLSTCKPLALYFPRNIDHKVCMLHSIYFLL